MPRRRLIVRPVKVNLSLPGELAEKLKAFLSSSHTGTVPPGAYQRFFVERIEEFFDASRKVGNQLLKEIEE